jgi:fructose-bisphosphate aldolase class I
MDKAKLAATAQQLVAKEKGILAADESTPTIKKRLASINVESTEANRRDYRAMLFATEGLEQYISGVILYDETLRQNDREGVPLRQVLSDKGIIPGIKVDMGAKPLAFFPGEKVTEGLTGLRDRFAEYAQLGARFSKWRAVIATGEGLPTDACIEANAHALARFAALSQEADIVPIVEPEVLMTGTHTVETHAEATLRTLRVVFAQLKKYRVYLEGMLLKPNMVASGLEAEEKVPPARVAQETLKVFKEAVPAEVPGIVFLSGGLTPDEATENLYELNSSGPQPWELSFSFGRALQNEALKTWGGDNANNAAAQKALLERARLVSLARSGRK